jgi:ElaB/YqjD/DUF883 family membrane-anchored ribosome-binding protein
VRALFDRRTDAARLRATEARAKVIATVGEVRHRLDPRTVAAETAEGMLGHVNQILGDATAVAKSRPWLLAAGASLVGVVLTLRRRKGSEA